MGRKIIVGAVLVILAVLVGVGMVMIAKKQTGKVGVTAPSGQGSLQSLLESQTPVVCSFTLVDKTASVSGTTYVAGGKMRTDFRSGPPPLPLMGHLIVSSSNVYVWTTMSNQGYKSQLVNQAKNQGMGPAPAMDQPVTYTCKDWTGDQTMFNLPVGVTFNTMVAPAGTLPPVTTTSPEDLWVPTGTGSAQQCAVCNNGPAGPWRTDCLTHLHCPQ